VAVLAKVNVNEIYPAGGDLHDCFIGFRLRNWEINKRALPARRVALLEWLSLCLLTLICESKIRNLTPGAARSSLGILPMH
jgi:hypothetical protein